MKKILTVIGARPQFIKASSISREIIRRDDLNEIIIHTGQHYDQNMSSIFFDELSIPEPNYNLGIVGSSHGLMTGRQLEAIEKVLFDENPDCVIVYGDTNSTLAGALAAAKMNIPLAHVEAGLRSFNRTMPEEINRILTDHASNILFTPTATASSNLLNEGINEAFVKNVGDVMFDASIFFKEKARKPFWMESLTDDLSKFALATIHRAENTDNKDKLKKIFKGLSASPIPVIVPLHPRTKSKLNDQNIKISKNIFIVEPVGYLEMIWLESNCSIVCTDSGGVQKEAYFFQKPCLTLRDETEWIELVNSGWNTLVGCNEDAIIDGIKDFKPPIDNLNLYGDGNSSKLILDELINADIM
jgi:UDP-GlcNAc3NAcA epimerase